ncbi:sigma factor-like helix-turn-helix DNA-binding protein [Saccharothrix espanaensis]|uniref:RNA polymerase sigma factor 70 region 4 type 2 domain-containing protein n=1 Tax=Saccharothrix espanaensis (strain ATCC 51144 / DSM 44229 / JCM 9112 / NBRC 15066 / NRRL 15764) TaxID=1179773 RepID=K0K1I7_SACES|nr:hypothetical protein BN6_41450 [Saccharothrix espanaensis DSM 44229]
MPSVRWGDGTAIGGRRLWLTTVVGRVCLDMLRSRTSRREDPLEVHLPDPVVTSADDPGHAAVVADPVGLALLVVLETLKPAERLAFVLHDLFGVSFDEIAPIVGRTPTAARQLASRARRRVRTGAPAPDDVSRQREVVDAFLAATSTRSSPTCPRWCAAHRRSRAARSCSPSSRCTPARHWSTARSAWSTPWTSWPTSPGSGTST